MRKSPHLRRDTFLFGRSHRHHHGHSDAPEDNESVMTDVPKPLLCMVKWGVDGLIGGVLHPHAVACIHARPDLGATACDFSLSIGIDQAAPDFPVRGSVAVFSKYQLHEQDPWKIHSRTLFKPSRHQLFFSWQSGKFEYFICKGSCFCEEACVTCSQLPMICRHGILGASASVMVSFFFGEMWEDSTECSVKRRFSSA